MTLLESKRMPTFYKKPEACKDSDCIAAFNEFVELTKSENCKKEDTIAGLGCWRIPKGRNVTGGTQYKIAYRREGTDGKEITCYFKPKLHRMWFYGSEDNIKLAEDHNKYTVSHLCHTSDCCNPAHLVLEDLATNKSRNVCPGGSSNLCSHRPSCLRPGHQFDENSEVVVWSQEENKMVRVKTANLAKDN